MWNRPASCAVWSCCTGFTKKQLVLASTNFSNSWKSWTKTPHAPPVLFIHLSDEASCGRIPFKEGKVYQEIEAVERWWHEMTHEIRSYFITDSNNRLRDRTPQEAGIPPEFGERKSTVGSIFGPWNDCCDISPKNWMWIMEVPVSH